ncbi:MAG: hypothetical protein Kow00105_10820 [Phycisphaeraceae bacterium]
MSEPDTPRSDANQMTLPPNGRIDIHSHLIPDIDDGCTSIEDTIESIHLLTRAGYVGSICTPHVWPELFPDNTPANIHRWTDHLIQQLRDRGIDYTLWPGGELRLFDRCIDWLKAFGVPTLGDSRYVLTDFWEDRWPRYADRTYDWLLSEGYQPILAHPERIGMPDGLEKHLDAIADRGIRLQGNFRCMTGEDGYLPDQRVRLYLQQNRYWIMGLDAHRSSDLPSRLDGLDLTAQEFGPTLVDQMTIARPREILSAS